LAPTPAANCAIVLGPISSCGFDVRLLVTRPEPDAERTAAALRASGHVVIVAPLLRIEPVEDAEIAAGPFAAILVTSANAASAIARHRHFAQLRSLPVFAVGGRTAQAMRAAGFVDVASADGDARDLARLVAQRVESGASLLYLAGADRAGDLAGSLSAQGFVVRTAAIYRAAAVAVLPSAAADALARGVDGVLHFSRRSAEAYVRAVHSAGIADNALNKPTHFCLSAQVAEALAQAGAADIRVASEPVEPALIALVRAP
jgi:uroporphyrinogen-III synthase